MAYCTYLDITDEISTSLGKATQEIVERRILKSDEQIVATLLEKGITTPPTSDTRLRDASIYLTCAWIKRRQSHELSRTNSTGLSDGTSFSTSPEAEAVAFEKKAADSIEQYANYAGGSPLIMVSPCPDIRSGL